MKEKIKKLFSGESDNEEKNDKKKIENLIVLVLVIIVTIVAINYIWHGNDENEDRIVTEDNTKKLAETSNVEESTSNNDIEYRLENILSDIRGVGKVKVLVTYSQTNQVIPMYDEDSTQTTTEETDSSGGTRITNESSSKKDIIYEEKDNKKSPITQSIVSAKIEGAIVTAEGAKNSEVKTNIIQAVEAVTGLSTYKIQVFEMKTN